MGNEAGEQQTWRRELVKVNREAADRVGPCSAEKFVFDLTPRFAVVQPEKTSTGESQPVNDCILVRVLERVDANFLAQRNAVIHARLLQAVSNHAAAVVEDGFARYRVLGLGLRPEESARLVCLKACANDHAKAHT